jgi:hypothetical protein
MKTPLALLLGLALVSCSIASEGQGSHIVITPATPVFGQLVQFSWNGSGDDVTFNITCAANATTEPAQPIGTEVASGGGIVTEDGTPQPLTMAMGPTSNWTAGGADCLVYADIFSYSGGSGKYQRKFASNSFVVTP